MKKSFRFLESTLWILGKGICTKLFCDYSGWFYIFDFTISDVFHIALIKHSYPSMPKYEFRLSIFKKKIFDTARKYHNETSEWYELHKQEQKEKAQKAKEILENAEMLDTAKEYQSGSFYLENTP